MKKSLPFLLFVLVLTGCKSTRVGTTEHTKIHLLDEYIIPDSLFIEGTQIGGLSGITYHDGIFFMVSDHPGNPRFYRAEIKFREQKIDTLIFTNVIPLNTSGPFLENKHLDMEGIVFHKEDSTFTISSEGAIKNKKDPAIFKVNFNGAFLKNYDLPEYFLVKKQKGPRNNGVFEGLANSYDNKGIWAATELPLKVDGPKPKIVRTKSPIRFTYFNKDTKKPVKQFVYLPEPIAKIPWLYYAVNGVSDFLQYAPNKFLVVERGFVAGHGNRGTTIRIFDVDASMTTNTLAKNNLNISFYNPAKKELLYDFKWAKDFLSQGFIDNIEGITFGPKLPNGKRSLLLISDNNFNSYMPQLNQVILMAFSIKE